MSDNEATAGAGGSAGEERNRSRSPESDRDSGKRCVPLSPPPFVSPPFSCQDLDGALRAPRGTVTSLSMIMFARSGPRGAQAETEDADHVRRLFGYMIENYTHNSVMTK